VNLLAAKGRKTHKEIYFMAAIETSLGWVRELFETAFFPWAVPVEVRRLGEECDRVEVSFVLWREKIEFEMEWWPRRGWTPDPDSQFYINDSETVWQWMAMLFQGALNLEKEERRQDVAKLPKGGA